MRKNGRQSETQDQLDHGCLDGIFFVVYTRRFGSPFYVPLKIEGIWPQSVEVFAMEGLGIRQRIPSLFFGTVHYSENNESPKLK